MKYVWMAIKGLLVLALFLAMLHMWPDEDLDPDLQRWRAHRAGGPVTAENFHYGVFGFMAPAGEDPFVAGRGEVERYITFGVYANGDFEDGLEVSDEVTNAGVDRASWDALRPRLDELEAQHAELLTRYLMLHAARDQSFPIESSWAAPLPPYYTVLRFQKLVLLRIAERIESGDADAAAWGWEMLASQLAAHRRFMANAEHLIERVSMAAMIENDLAAYAALMSRPTADGGVMPPALPAALTIAERSMLAPFRHEATMAEFSDEDMLWQALAQNGSGFEVPLAKLAPFDYNATMNQMTAHARLSAELSLLPADEFSQREDELQYEEPSIGEWLTNPLGTILFAVAIPNNAQLIRRTHELDGRIALLKIMARARTEGIGAEAMPEFLESLGPALRNPYDGSAARFDDGTLRFDIAHTSGEDLAFAFTPGR